MNLTRQQAIKIIDDRIREGVYGRYEIGNTWPFGIFKGKDIQDIPDQYYYWHVLNNEEVNKFHLTYIRSRFEVCDWKFEKWTKPDEQAERAGHYRDSFGGHYNGSPPRPQPVSEDLYWFKMKQAQGIFPQGISIKVK